MKAVSSALVLALFATMSLAGCGQKGPLYLPGEVPESQTDGPFGINQDDNDTSDRADRDRDAAGGMSRPAAGDRDADTR